MLKELFVLLATFPTIVPYVHQPQKPVFFCVGQEKLTLNLFFTTTCPYSKKVLAYLDQIHKKIPMTNVHNNPKALDYLQKRGGKLQVPCLFIDGRPLYEADAIIAWLSEHQESLECV